MPPVLRPFVLTWVGYDFRLEPDAVHHGVPSTGLTVVLSMDEPVDCGWLDVPGSERFEVLVAGLHMRPALIRTHGHQYGMHLALNPLGALTLLGVPAGILAGEMVDAAELGWPRHLVERMREVGWSQRFEILEEFVLVRLATSRAACRSEVVQAWETIRRTSGIVSVEQVAASTGLSRRRLSTLMRHEIGLTPKHAARVARFEHAHQLLGSGRPLAEVAGTAGYSDQSHLNREWKALAGITPTTSRDDFSFVQDKNQTTR